MQIGFNARLFPNNWRPALNEVAFAHKHGFTTLQFGGKVDGLRETDLGASFSIVREALKAANVAAVMEIIIRLENGLTNMGKTPLDVLRSNLPAIIELRCGCVHWHILFPQEITDADAYRFEDVLLAEFEVAVKIAQAHTFQFGIENNEPGWHPFKSPQSCTRALKAVAGLYLVWDVNHTPPNDLAAYLELVPRMSMVHVSDTVLPEVNHHLPLGMGKIDFRAYCCALRDRGFVGPAILEIGGLPKSGGYGRDTDMALVDSLQRFRQANLS